MADVTLITVNRERTLASAVESPEVTTMLSSWRGRGPAMQRLTAALEEARVQVDQYAEHLENVVDAQRLLNDARVAARAGRVYFAWDRLLALERLLVSALSPEERRLKAAVYMEELEAKVHNWRQKAGKAAVKSSGAPHDEGYPPGHTPTVAQLRALMEMVHQTSQNWQFKIEILHRQISLLLGLMLVMLISLMAVAWYGHLPWNWANGQTGLTNLGEGALLGLVGSVLSIAFALFGPNEQKAIPELRTAFAFFLVRPLLGIWSGIIMAALVHSNAISIDSNTGAKLALYFSAGFSERWFRNKLESILEEKTGK